MRQWRVTAGDLVRLYRVRDWIHFLPLPLAGWVAAADATMTSLVGGLFGWGFGLGYASAINQAFDDRLDQLTLGKNPVGGSLRRRQAILLSVPAALACLTVVAWLSPAAVVPAVVFLIVATVYSAPPRLKRVPVLGTVWNVVVGVPGLFFAAVPDLTTGAPRVSLGVFAVLLLVAQLIHEAEDRDDDRAGGIATVGTLAGMRGALGAAAALVLLLPTTAWCLADDLRLRIPLTCLAGVFAVAWTVVLATRVVRNDAVGLRTMRLRYRYAAFVMGLLAFAATIL